MQFKKWSELPTYMQCEEVKPYYRALYRKQKELKQKRMLDVILSLTMIIILSPLMLVLSLMIKLDSPGPVFFRQERITTYGRVFRIFKFRTMVNNAEKLGTQVTVNNDSRITRVGNMLRKLRIDELPQLFNVLLGDMTFVGTRPEVKKYVKAYSKEMYATLLLPAGITSKASIEFKDEDAYLDGADDIDKVYIEKVLPMKMKYNLESIKNFSVAGDVITMFRTVFAVLR